MATKKKVDEPKLIGNGGPQPTTEDILRNEFNTPQLIGRGGPQPTVDGTLIKDNGIDPTIQPAATSQADVDMQDAKTRLWQQLDYTYGNQQKKSDEAYDQAYSQADRQALARGMGRSSYNNQTLANLANKKIEAQNEIGEAKIAAYQSGLNTLEQQAKEDEWRQKQWDYQLERDKVSDERYAEERDYSRSRDTIADQRYEDELAYSRGRDTIADQRYEDELAYSRGRDELADQRYIEERDYSRGRDELADQRYEEELAYDREWQQKQWDEQVRQWNEQFEYSKMSTEQQLNYNYVLYALENGNDVSDEMLAKAGLSREDFNAMKKETKKSGSKGTGGGGGDEWKKAGFSDKETYEKAKAAGFSDRETYEKAKALGFTTYAEYAKWLTTQGQRKDAFTGDDIGPTGGGLVGLILGGGDPTWDFGGNGNDNEHPHGGRPGGDDIKGQGRDFLEKSSIQNQIDNLTKQLNGDLSLAEKQAIMGQIQELKKKLAQLK